VSLYSYLQYLKHKFTAKTRHGVHSPYVYTFVEQVLNDYTSFDTPAKYSKFFGAANIKYLPSAYPKHWSQLVLRELNEAHNDLVIAIPNIHASSLHDKEWQNLVAMPEVKLSMDTYEYGLLLFRNEFKEKQHFKVKG
jgi:hypothetical protein